jgi:hypothetical protein
MNKTVFSIVFMFVFTLLSMSQNPFVGTFEGTYNGDKVVLTLQNPNGNNLIGKMKDSQQNYEVTAVNNGNAIQGKALEKTLNLTFNLSGVLNNTQLTMQMTLNYNGQTAQFDIVFNKKGGNSPQNVASNNINIKFPVGATHDANVVGMWAKNETYNSGSGDNFMGANFQQTMIFYADGSVGDGGSSASMSGSNYSGSSSGAGKALPGLYWYTIGNQLYLFATQNGQSETVHLGKYYIENGAMLITGTNNVKLLLYKK